MKLNCNVSSNQKGDFIVERIIDPANGNTWRIVDAGVRRSFSTPVFVDNDGKDLSGIVEMDFSDKLGGNCKYLFFAGQIGKSRQLYRVTKNGEKYGAFSLDVADLGDYIDYDKYYDVDSCSLLNGDLRVNLKQFGMIDNVMIFDCDTLKPKTMLLKSITPIDLDDDGKNRNNNGYNFTADAGDLTFVSGTMDENYHITSVNSPDVTIEEVDGVETVRTNHPTSTFSKEFKLGIETCSTDNYVLFYVNMGDGIELYKKSNIDGTTEKIELGEFVVQSITPTEEKETFMLTGTVNGVSKQCYFSARRAQIISDFVDQFLKPVAISEIDTSFKASEGVDKAAAHKKGLDEYHHRYFAKEVEINGEKKRFIGIMRIDGEINDCLRDPVNRNYISTPFTSDVVPTIDDAQLIQMFEKKDAAQDKASQQIYLSASRDFFVTNNKQKHPVELGDKKVNYVVHRTKDREIVGVDLNTTFTRGFKGADAIHFLSLFVSPDDNTEDTRTPEDENDSYSPAVVNMKFCIDEMVVVAECHVDGVDMLNGPCKISCFKERKGTIADKNLDTTLSNMAAVDMDTLSHVINFDLLFPAKEEKKAESKTEPKTKEKKKPTTRRRIDLQNVQRTNEFKSTPRTLTTYVEG